MLSVDFCATIVRNTLFNENPIIPKVSRQKLRDLVAAKLRTFHEEELCKPLVLFDEVLDHIVRIDRVLSQPLGHLLLVGSSGAGKTVLSKFVSWMNGLSVFQIKAGRNYDITAFENDLRLVMKRAGIKEEKVTFIFDESNVLGPAFLERMNALLASGEVPGLFEGDEYLTLISECKAAYSGHGDAGMVHFRRSTTPFGGHSDAIFRPKLLVPNICRCAPYQTSSLVSRSRSSGTCILCLR